MTKTQVLDSKCPHCGGKVEYNPKISKWKCLYCDSEMTLEEMQQYNNASSDVNNESVKDEEVDQYDDYFTYSCKNCGGQIIADKETTATFCVYCGNTAILKNKLSGKFTPSKIIPFKKNQKDAEEAFISLAKGRPLTPKSFTDKSNIEKIRGIYVPFWFHTFKVAGAIDYTGEIITHWSTASVDYTKTDIYDVYKDGEVFFRSVPTDGSTRFDDDLMNTIQPYDYKDLVPYNHAYLSGFLAERYDVSENDTRKLIEKDILNDAKNLFLREGRYHVRNIRSNTLKTENYEVSYVLLPVYMVNVKYHNKMYMFAMNGQTGEFIGNIPIDRKKAFFIGIILFLVLFLVLLLGSYIMFKVGGQV